jgi:hypothetical protein
MRRWSADSILDRLDEGGMHASITTIAPRTARDRTADGAPACRGARDARLGGHERKALVTPSRLLSLASSVPATAWC